MRRFLLLTAAIIVYGSLFPWHFDFTAAPGNPLQILLQGWPAQWNNYVLRDVVVNIAVYMPLGLAAYLTLRRRQSRGISLMGAVALGYLLSVSMELLQVYVPGRTSSLLDVLDNTAGSAAGALFALCFENQLRNLVEIRGGRPRTAAALLLALWAFAALFPLIPNTGLTHLRQSLALLIHFRDFSPVEMWVNAAEWFAVAMAVDFLFASKRGWWLAAFLLCIPAQLIIIGRQLTLPEVAGALLALVLWQVAPRDRRAQWCVWMLGSGLLLRQLQPFYLLAVPQPFSWVPFAATLVSDRGAGAVIIAGKAFDYGALIWALRRAGWPYGAAGIAVAAPLAATEALQTYLPGRTPEITDPLLALLMMVILAVMTRGKPE